MSSISPPIPENLARAYSILEVRPMSTNEEVRAAYLDLVKIWHPDRHHTEPDRLRRKAEDKLKEIVNAYETIQKHGEMAEEVPLIAMDFGEFWGFIDEQGKTVIHPEFSQARGFVRGLAAVQSVEKWGFIDKNGYWRINPLYEDCSDFAEGLAAVRWYGRWGFIDSQGAFAIPPRYQEARSFADGWADVRLGARWGKVNPAGELVFDPTGSGHHIS